MLDKNSLFIIPDLMNKTTREDHGLIGIAGAVFNKTKQYSTDTGKKMATFLSFILQTYFNSKELNINNVKQIKT